MQTQEIIDLLKQTSPLQALSFNLINRKQLLQESFRIKEVLESLLNLLLSSKAEQIPFIFAERYFDQQTGQVINVMDQAMQTRIVYLI